MRRGRRRRGLVKLSLSRWTPPQLFADQRSRSSRSPAEISNSANPDYPHNRYRKLPTKTSPPSPVGGREVSRILSTGRCCKRALPPRSSVWLAWRLHQHARAPCGLEPVCYQGQGRVGTHARRPLDRQGNIRQYRPCRSGRASPAKREAKILRNRDGTEHSGPRP